MLRSPSRRSAIVALATCGVSLTACSLLLDDSGLSGGDTSTDAGPTDAALALDTFVPSEGAVPDAAASRYVKEVLADQPVAFYRFRGNDATRDEVSGKSGNIVGTLSTGVPGAITEEGETAAAFGDGYITASDALDFDGAAKFSVEAWVKPNVVSTEYWAIVAKQQSADAATQNIGWVLGVSASGNRGLFFSRSNATEAGFLASEVQPQPGTFTHVVATTDGSMERVYVDGVLAKEFGYGAIAIPDTSVSLQIGRSYAPSSAFRGVIDEVAIYASALPAARIKAHYEAAKP